MRLRHLVISSLVALSLGSQADIARAAEGVETGDRITIETSDKPLETVLQWISRRSGVNIVCNEQDQPRVTVRLINVTWQEAVEQIAQKYDLVVDKKNDRIWQLSRPPKVRMEFQDARLTVILEALARQAGVNIVISDDVASDKRLTMTLNGVPWKEALDVIVKASGYAWIEQDYHIVRVVSPDKLSRDVETRVFRINYASVVSGSGGGGGGGEGGGGGGSKISLVELVTKQLGSGDSVIGDERTNSMIVTAPRPTLDKIARLVAELDTRTREVLIEMKFVDFSNDDAKRIGFDPITFSFDVRRLGTITQAFRPFNASPTSLTSFNRNGAASPPSSGNFSTGLTFEAISQLNSTELLQAPQILTLDNTQATIFIGRKIRYAEESITTEGSGTTSTPVRTLKEASGSPVEDGIRITVKPTITSDGYVALQLDASNENATLVLYTNKADDTDPNASTIRLPNTDATRITTSIMIGDGKTGVIGGLLRNKVFEDERKIPVVGSIPVLGWLFKKREDRVEQRNLTIFITPRIIPLNDKSEYEQRKQELRERLSGIKEKPATGAGNPGDITGP